MYQIIPNLYLSSYNDVQVSANTFIVNCTKDLEMLNDNNIRLAVNDDMSQDAIQGMYLALPEVVEEIDRQLKNNKDVVVHCRAGQQRSATVITAYLIAKYAYNLKDAIAFVKNKKPDAFFWMVNFEESLIRYENHCWKQYKN